MAGLYIGVWLATVLAALMRLGGPGAAINKAVAAELLVGGRVVDSDPGCRHKCRPAGVSAPEGGSAQVP
jgi:hypothetical protein